MSMVVVVSGGWLVGGGVASELVVKVVAAARRVWWGWLHPLHEGNTFSGWRLRIQLIVNVFGNCRYEIQNMKKKQDASV